MTKTADKVSEAIQAEGNVDPKIVKILVKDAVDAKFKEAAAEKKQQDANSGNRQTNKSKSKHYGSKNSGGAQRPGGASSKNISPTSASANLSGGSKSATNAGKKGRQLPS